ncbi:hypothetical protein Pfo_022086 [Paulownia fortunei]|nr:hypothetical protein Pfo_022086 [Paulownia fortunei]
MPTTFIAVQCFQCCTMQAILSLSLSVKQQKKSSNKWGCVVCNQKQSVRKVFSQGVMARDVRKFVQNFNMSRQLSDQKQLLSEELETFNSPSGGHKTKRNDWSEYVDDQEEYCGKFDKDEDLAEGDNRLEPMVVTEVPKALFKKPKVKDYSSNGYGTEKLFKPLFPDTSNAKRHRNDHSQDVQLTEFEQTSCERDSKRSEYSMRAQDICSHEEPVTLHPSDRAPKWNRFMAQIQDNKSNSANIEEPFVKQPRKGVKGSISKWSGYITQDDEHNGIGVPMVGLHHTTAAKGPVSKWSSFITEEDEDNLESKGQRDSRDHVSQRSNYLLDSLMNEERVEDDIHPDFL